MTWNDSLAKEILKAPLEPSLFDWGLTFEKEHLRSIFTGLRGRFLCSLEFYYTAIFFFLYWGSYFLTLTMRHRTERILSWESHILTHSRIVVRYSILISFFLRHPYKECYTWLSASYKGCIRKCQSQEEAIPYLVALVIRFKKSGIRLESRSSIIFIVWLFCSCLCALFYSIFSILVIWIQLE